MFNEELGSFLQKFHQLRLAGQTAHLDIDTFAGKAWVGLRVMLSDDVPVYHQQNTRRRSPSYYRRQERRKAARTEAAVDPAQSNSDATTEEVEVTSPVEVAEPKIDNCELCDFKTDRKNGLEIHMRKKHAVLEQLDGNNSCEDESDDDNEDNNYYELSEPYWRTGEIGWRDIDIYENALKAIDNVFWRRNQEKMKEMMEEVHEARKKSLDKKFNDPILGVYPISYCNIKSTI